MKSVSGPNVSNQSVSPDILQGIKKSSSAQPWANITGQSSISVTPVDTSLDTSVDEFQSGGVRSFKLKRANNIVLKSIANIYCNYHSVNTPIITR